MSTGKGAGTARERLLRAAGEVFYREGIHVVGIDRILVLAGVAKSSLYDNFKSKDELVRAYLEERAAWLQKRIEDRIARETKPRDRIFAVFDEFAERVAVDSGYCGCPFIRACAEGGGEPTSARDVSSAHRRWQRDLFERLAGDGGIPGAADLSRQLCLIYDGATVAVAMDGEPAAALAAREVVRRLLGEHDGKAPARRRPAKAPSRRAKRLA